MPSSHLEYTMTIHRIDADPLRFKLRRTADEIRNAGAAIGKPLSRPGQGGSGLSHCRWNQADVSAR